ncbi:MAG: hypothetical protein WCD80_04385 [Desulfobaccales bacterium]
MPIVKKKTDILSMVDAIFVTYYNKQLMSKIVNLHDELLNEFEISDDDQNGIEIKNELIIMDIVIKYIITLEHYKNYYKYNELKDKLDRKIKQLLADLWGQDNLNDLYQFLMKRCYQYQKAFSKEDPIKTIAKMVQLIIEKIAFFDSEQVYDKATNNDNLYIAADMLAMPVITHFMPCHILVGNSIITYRTFLNKWELE